MPDTTNRKKQIKGSSELNKRRPFFKWYANYVNTSGGLIVFIIGIILFAIGLIGEIQGKEGYYVYTKTKTGAGVDRYPYWVTALFGFIMITAYVKEKIFKKK